MSGVVVWPDGNPNSTGPGNPAATSSMTSRAVTAPPGSSQRGNWPKTIADARREPAAQAQLRQHAVQPVRPLAHFVDEAARGPPAAGIRTASRATRAAASACRRTSGPAGLAGAERSRARRATARPSGSVAQAAQERRGDRRRRSPSRSRPSIIGPCTRRQADVARRETRGGRDVAVADERRARPTDRDRRRAAAASRRCRSRRAPRSTASTSVARQRAHQRRGAGLRRAGDESRRGRRRARRRPARDPSRRSSATPASNSARSNGLAGATSATRLPGRPAGT